MKKSEYMSIIKPGDLISLKQPFIYGFCILIFAFLTFFYNYHRPRGLFWDENYHIASAEKYIAGIMFMEPHPPLGKMLIAVGEVILHPNSRIDKSGFLGTHHIREVPEGYSFAGVRLASTLLATLSVLLFFLILYYISPQPFFVFIFSFLYLFDNALVLHTRGAMLEGIQLFFIILTLFYFVVLCKASGSLGARHYLVLGIFISLAVSVKVNSLIIAPLPLFLVTKEYRGVISFSRNDFSHWPAIGKKLLLCLLGFLFIFCAVWYLHFALGREVYNNDFYKASAQYKEILEKKATANPLYFFTMLKDNLYFISQYHKGVPRLDLTKKGENGSHPLGWPIGNKGINYRWLKKDNKVSYLFLIGNPVNWFLGLIALLAAPVVLIVHGIRKRKIISEHSFMFLIIFLVLYMGYILTMIFIQRVLYLYHYFIPLIFTYALVYILFTVLFKNRIEQMRKHIIILTTVLGILIFSTFLFFRPLTYYTPLSRFELQLRSWCPWWGLKFIE